MSGVQGISACAGPSTSPEKKHEKSVNVEMKKGKVIFKQKPISFEKNSETLQEIVAFRGMLEEKINNQETPLTVFPEGHKPLIAKLAHESDKTLGVLVKHIHHELLPTVDDDDEQSSVIAQNAIPVSLVEDAVKSILSRNNYGIEMPPGVKPPAAVSIWRWEVKSEHMDWLPKNGREKAEARQQERVQAQEELKKIFAALTQEERDIIIDPKKTNKLPPKELNRTEMTPNPDVKAEEKPAPDSAKKQGKKKDVSENDQSESTKGPGRSKKPQDPEKASKEKERQDKKVARVEKEKKEKDAHNKSQNIMANFFNKPKLVSPTKPQQEKAAPCIVVDEQPDFERVFKPFVLGKDKVLAPQNWFHAERKRRQKAKTQESGPTIVIDDSENEEDIVMEDPHPSEAELASMPLQERLRQSLSTCLSSLTPIPLKPRNPSGLKIYYPESVRDIFTRLSEAEIGGNAEAVRELLDKLANRETTPAKAFCFHTDARPGYFGTWTRSSKIIGPRRPFTRDTLVFDYAQDSGEEWEEEGQGDDVAEDQEEEGGSDEDRDSDLDSWLDDDDEVGGTLAELEQKASSPPLIDLTVPSASPIIKRKTDDAAKKPKKKRKVELIIPTAKGPIYEQTIGDIPYELFQPFVPLGIQRFNDTPMSIDPFSFVSEFNGPQGPQDRKVSAPEGVYVLPALPTRLAPSNPSSSSAPKKPTVTPKFPFPDTYLQQLLEKITHLQTASFMALVDAIYHDLREYKVKKNAIEAKVKEVAEKCKEKKVWVVKPGVTAGVV